MTVDIPSPPRSGPWTPRVILALAVLSAAAFIYVTAEIMPVGALPAIAEDLRVSEATVGTLLAGYALVAAVALWRTAAAVPGAAAQCVLLLRAQPANFLTQTCLKYISEIGRGSTAT